MAIYTHLSSADVRRFLKAYDLPPLKRAEGIAAGIDNTNYLLFMEDGSKRILTVFEKRLAKEELPFFTQLMEHLARSGFPCPQPVRAQDGAVLLELKSKPAVIVSFLAGKEVKAPATAHVLELGLAIGQLHQATASLSITRDNSLSLAGWHTLFAKIKDQATKKLPQIVSEIELELAYLQEHWPTNLPRGIIHADLFPDNVFYDENGMLSGVIDFYFACNDFLAYELAIALNAWCFEDETSMNLLKNRGLLSSYQSVRKLSQEELDALPILARGASLRFLLTRIHDLLFPFAGAVVTPKNPMEYWNKLNFHRNVASYTEYGF